MEQIIAKWVKVPKSTESEQQVCGFWSKHAFHQSFSSCLEPPHYWSVMEYTPFVERTDSNRSFIVAMGPYSPILFCSLKGMPFSSWTQSACDKNLYLHFVCSKWVDFPFESSFASTNNNNNNKWWCQVILQNLLVSL